MIWVVGEDIPANALVVPDDAGRLVEYREPAGHQWFEPAWRAGEPLRKGDHVKVGGWGSRMIVRADR